MRQTLLLATVILGSRFIGHAAPAAACDDDVTSAPRANGDDDDDDGDDDDDDFDDFDMRDIDIDIDVGDLDADGDFDDLAAQVDDFQVRLQETLQARLRHLQSRIQAPPVPPRPPTPPILELGAGTRATIDLDVRNRRWQIDVDGDVD